MIDMGERGCGHRSVFCNAWTVLPTTGSMRSDIASDLSNQPRKRQGHERSCQIHFSMDNESFHS